MYKQGTKEYPDLEEALRHAMPSWLTGDTPEEKELEWDAKMKAAHPRAHWHIGLVYDLDPSGSCEFCRNNDNE